MPGSGLDRTGFRRGLVVDHLDNGRHIVLGEAAFDAPPIKLRREIEQRRRRPGTIGEIIDILEVVGRASRRFPAPVGSSSASFGVPGSGTGPIRRCRW
jgi:hypothetical protein